MKQFVTIALAILLAMSSTVYAFADDSPLAASDRLTAQLVNIQRQREEIEKIILQRENAKKAAIYSGRNSSASNQLNYFINRKILTKRDYEAFKWSFILSQFAVPLESSFLDVLADENINKMVEDNFTVIGVKEFLITDSTDTAASNQNSEIAMMQDTNFKDLVEHMKDNYAVYPIFDSNNTQPTLKDVLNKGFDIFEVLYLYDTLAAEYPVTVSGNTLKSKDASNALFYNQENIQYSNLVPDEVKIPVFVYDANSYMYLQIAIGAYLKAHGDGTKASLLAERGNEPLCIDTYGNICVLSEGSAEILLPNFGNSFLNARSEEGSNNSLVESMNLYNKWFVTLYCSVSRTRNTVYEDIMSIEYMDTVSVVNDANGSQILKGDDKVHSHYTSYLQLKDNGDLSGTLFLVETGRASTMPTKDIMSLAIGEDLWSKTPYYVYSHFNGEDGVDKSNTFATHANKIFTKIKEIPEIVLHGNWEHKANDSWASAWGILSSTYNSHINRYAPFVAESESQEFYINKFPIFVANIDLAETENKSNDLASSHSHFDRMANSLDKGVWEIMEPLSSNHNKYFSSPTDSTKNSDNLLIASDDLLTLITTFKDQQILDNRFASWVNAESTNGYFNTEVYIPKDLVDVGQNMEAYIGDEKGMFLAEHDVIYNAGFGVFREAVKEVAAKLCENMNNMKTATQDAKNLMEQLKSGNFLGGNLKGLLSSIDPNGASTLLKDTIYWDTGHKTLVLQYNDTEWNKTDSFQNKILIPWHFDLTNLLSQDALRYFYELQQEVGTQLNQSITWFKKVDFYGVTTYRKNGDFSSYRFSETPETGERTSSEHLGTIYYVDLSQDSITQDSITHNITCFPMHSNGVPSFSNVAVSGSYSSESAAETAEINLRERISYIQDQKLPDAGSWCTVFSKYLSKLLCCKLAFWGDTPTCDFTALMEDIQANFGIPANEVIEALMVGFSFTNHYYDSNDNNRYNAYLYDEYRYFLRNPTYLSHRMGYQTTNDFSTVTYFWDRHYLMQSAFQKAILAEMDSNWNSLKKDYTAYLGEVDRKYFSTDELPLQDYVTSLGTAADSKLIGTITEANGDTKTIEGFVPYYYEWSIQNRNEDPNATLSEQLESAKAAQEAQNTSDKITGGVGNPDALLEQQQSQQIQGIFGSNSAFYNFLDDDTILVYPFSRLSGDITNQQLEVRAGLGDAILAYSKSAEKFRANNAEGKVYVKTDLTSLIMALQCNTNFSRNSLEFIATKTPQQTNVSKEELMNNANQFFTNPVTSLSYIFTGFLYQVHSTFATGNIGSVFSINWLLESDAYKWIVNRYVAIIAIAIAVILLLKLVQFAMNKSRSAADIGRSVIGILAMCLVPMVIFNSFVWAFNSSSSWFLHGSLDKILLSQIDTKERERINSDPGVTAELNAFKEQFKELDIQGYECISFDEMASYSLEKGPTYKSEGIWSYMDNVVYTKTDGKNWYSTSFQPIHSGKYKDSLFYFFYDFIRAEYFNYCSTHPNTGGNTGAVASLVKNIEDAKAIADEKTAVQDINVAEQSIAMLTGGFQAMLKDTAYVYGDTINDLYEYKTNGPKVKDLVGGYLLFNNYGTTDTWQNEIKSSPYYKAWLDSSLMVAEDNIVPKRWNDQAYMTNYFESAEKQRGKWEQSGGYYIITSYLDLFNQRFNAGGGKELTVSDIAITPLEEKLCAVSDDIYNTTLKALNYLPDQIHDESAITLMAMIATCKYNEAFGCAPTEPILQSVTLDSFVRTAFLTKLEDVGSNVNTLYAMVTQGESIGKILVVVVLELIICIASVARVLIILYITVASFVILGLRLLHKAPSTTDLVYGIIGNMVALLVLHLLTLFLVVIAIEAVAGAVSVVPSILLDILMFAFIFIMIRALFKLIKNIAKDAVNIGGAKIKGMIHAVGDSILKATHGIMHTDVAQAQAATINLSSSNTVYTPEEELQLSVERRRVQVATIVENIRRIEEQSATSNAIAENGAVPSSNSSPIVNEEEEERARQRNAQVQKTLSAETKVISESSDTLE